MWVYSNTERTELKGFIHSEAELHMIHKLYL